MLFRRMPVSRNHMAMESLYLTSFINFPCMSWSFNASLFPEITWLWNNQKLVHSRITFSCDALSTHDCFQRSRDYGIIVLEFVHASSVHVMLFQHLTVSEITGLWNHSVVVHSRIAGSCDALSTHRRFQRSHDYGIIVI
jgi:hypothetical protein